MNWRAFWRALGACVLLYATFVVGVVMADYVQTLLGPVAGAGTFLLPFSVILAAIYGRLARRGA